MEAFHQISLTYRENYNRRIAFGAKLSYLSGIAYSRLNIQKSSLKIDQAAQSYSASVEGSFRSNFLFDEPDVETIRPGFKNPGVAFTLSGNYKTRSGLFLLANLKDLGMI